MFNPLKWFKKNDPTAARKALDPDWAVKAAARLETLETVLGPATLPPLYADTPFASGPDGGGTADVVCFHEHIAGQVSVTSELIGNEGQQRNSLGNYELMICHRDNSTWGAGLISRLAHYTMTERLEPGECMDIRPAVPDDATISALLYLEYAHFKVANRPCGLLLCVGITDDELALCRVGRLGQVEGRLKACDVYPYTELRRQSVL